jgi:ankyrin repeat protein
MNTIHFLIHRIYIMIFVFLCLSATGLQAGEIHNAAAAGDLNKVKALLEADSTLLESKDNDGNTPLISACWGQPSAIPQLAVANYLIDKGADINAKNNRGGTSLYFATKDFNLCQHLIARGADVNIRAYDDYTPLHQAAFRGNLKAAKLLIDHGADVNFRGRIGTAIQRIITSKTESGTEMVKLLLENGASLQKFSFGDTELHLAAINGYADVIPILIKYGADVNAVNDYDHTPLYYAAMHGHRKTAEELIAAGANTRAIIEANYGKSAQLSEKLKEGEAYLWYLGGVSPGVGYAVKTKEHLFLFNPPEVDDSPEAGLANGRLNPNELAGQKITALILYPSYQPRFGPSIPDLAKKIPGIDVVLNFKPTVDSSGSNKIPLYHLAAPHDDFSLDGIRVHTIPAAGKVWFSSEGLGYLVEADGVKIFHAGLHITGKDYSDIEKYRKEIDYLKPFGPIDIVILPVNGRHVWWIDYESYLYLIDQLSVKAVYLIGDDLAAGEHEKCIKVLQSRNVRVEYPEGGIALGQRFHYLPK